MVIVDREQGKKVTKLFNKHNIDFHMGALGLGTAPSEARSYFGFGETEKAIVFAIVAEDVVSKLFKILREEMHMDEPNSGIAFSMPISSFSSKVVLQYIMGIAGAGSADEQK